MALAGVGVLGVIPYAVTKRAREIGIRIALGAQRRDVLRPIIGQGIKLTSIGVAVCLLASLVLTRIMKSLLYDVTATDPAAFLLIPLLLAGVTLLACYIPARWVMRVDPLAALRCE
jgi:putative ABC transport system permease protein